MNLPLYCLLRESVQTNRRTSLQALLSALLIIAGCAMTPALAGDVLEVQQGTFNARVVVKADGSVEIGEIDGAEGPVVAVIRRKLAALRYFPAQRDGVAVTTSSRLSGRVTLTPVDNQYEVAVSNVSLAPSLLSKGVAPIFPADRCRADEPGTVELLVRIGPDGRVLQTRTVSNSHSDFARATTAAVKQWRFEALPEDQDWTEIAAPFLFLVEKRAHPVSSFQCDATGRARVEGEPSCLDRMEVMCSRVRK